MKEFILCAAIWYQDGKKHNDQPENIDNGFVICGRRHNNCYSVIEALSKHDKNIRLSVDKIENSMTDEQYKKHHGFITSMDRYVDRKEAYEIAKLNDQIKFVKDSSDEYKILISESLY